MIISAIIATKNRSDLIHHPLSSLAAGKTKPHEIIVLDQSDTSKTREVVEQFASLQDTIEIKHIASKRSGLGANRNDALLAAKGDFICSVDDDVSVHPFWLQRMVEEWVYRWEKKDVLITGSILPPAETNGSELITAIRTSDQRKVFVKTPRFTNVLYGAQFGAPQTLFRSMGVPFDERFGVGSIFQGADDDEFAYRVLKAGFPLVYEPSIKVYHYAKPIKEWRKLRFRRAVAFGAAVGKHFQTGDRVCLRSFFEAILNNISKSIKYGVQMKEPEASSRLLATVGIFTGFFKWFYTYPSNDY